MTDEPVRRIGDFRLLERIGAGAMGDVFLAEHTQSSRRCVVKVLPRELTFDPGFPTRYEEGAWRIAELDHRSIVRIRHFGCDGDDYFLAMDYVADAQGPARSVQDLLDRRGGGRLGSGRVKRIAVQVLAALGHAHDRGVLHLCLKPSSVLLDAGGRVKLTDFGLGLLVGPRALTARVSRTAGHATGQLPTWGPPGAGRVEEDDGELASGDAAEDAPAAFEEELPEDTSTNDPASEGDPEPEPDSGRTADPDAVPHLDEVVDYLPPEEKLGREDLDQRADIYAFGALLYRMLTGQRPGAIMARPSHLVRRLPPAWDAIVERCLEDQPEQRYPSAAAVLEDVAAVRRRRPSFSRRRVLRFAAAALLLVGAAWLAVKLVNLAGGPAASLEWSLRRTVRLPGGVRMPFVPIPPGSFRMGDPEAPDAPPATVRIARPYFLAVTEVTQAQWRAVMNENPSCFQGGTNHDDHPVECVSRADCERFIERLNGLELGRFRLPTEAEWEHACRAGGIGRYPWGEDAALLDAFAWHPGNAGHRTHPVGEKRPSAWGIHDMLGNVNEWCVDRYAPYPAGERVDPAVTPQGRDTVFRGGSYFPEKGDCRPGVRYHADRHVRIAFIGLRLVRDAEP